jgi:hypothetical protein
VCGRIAAAQVVVDEHAEAFVIVTQQGVGIGFPSDLQRLPRRIDRQWQHANCL